MPRLNYIKFLELLGIELNPAEPARAEVTFPVRSDFTAPLVIVPARTQVSADATDGGRANYFRNHALAGCAHRATISSVRVRRVCVPIHYSQNADAATGFQPLGSLADAESALMLAFTSNDLMPSRAQPLYSDPGGDGTGQGGSCGLPASAVFPSVDLRWEYWGGTDWLPLSLLKDESARAHAHRPHLSQAPKKGSAARRTLADDTTLRYWIRGRVASRLRTSADPARCPREYSRGRAGKTVQDEVLGGSDGGRDQVFQLGNFPILNETLILEVDEGDGFRRWQEDDKLFGSDADDRVYVLDRSGGTVRFGDGVNGAIPVGNVNNAGANVVARQYRFGGGKRGNVAAKTIRTLSTAITGIDDNGILNLRTAFGGREEERTARSREKTRPPLAIKSRCRAVTDKDFEFFATQAADIKHSSRPCAVPSRFS